MCGQGMDESPKDERRSAGSSRRSNKPLMEKRRRARINDCLTQLKTLVLQALKKDTTQYSKLEKADILEMTVKHLKMLQRHQMTAAMSADPFVMAKFSAGYHECANEIQRYLESVQGVSTEVRVRVHAHLSNCLSQLPVCSQGAQYLPAHLQSMQMQGPPGSHVITGAIPIGQYPWRPMCVSAPSMVPTAMASIAHPAGGFIKMEPCRSPAMADPKYFKVASSFKPPIIKQERASPDLHSPVAHCSPELSESMDSESCGSEEDQGPSRADLHRDLDSDLDRSRESETFSPCIDLSTPKPIPRDRWQELVDAFEKRELNRRNTSPPRPKPVEATAVRDLERAGRHSSETIAIVGPSNGQLPCGSEVVPASSSSGLPTLNGSGGPTEDAMKTEEPCGCPEGVADSKEREQNAMPAGDAPQADPQLPADGRMWRPW